MSNAQKRLALETTHNGLLDLLIGLEVDRGRRFIADNDLRASDQRTAQGEKGVEITVRSPGCQKPAHFPDCSAVYDRRVRRRVSDA